MNPFKESDWSVDPKDFVINKDRKCIKAGYQCVYFGIQRSTKHKCVIKQTHQTLKEEKAKRAFDRNIYTLATVDHPVMVPFVGFYEKNNYGFSIEVEIEKGSLLYYLEERRNGHIEPLFDDTHKLIISYGISHLMKHLHEHRIVNRDLKSSNVLLDSKLHPYLTDFGTSLLIDPSIKIDKTLEATTPAYMAPEFHNYPELYSNTFPIDVYSFGITMYELITELPPWQQCRNPFQIIRAVTSGERPEMPQSVPSNWKELITVCWAQEPDCRPTFEDICDVLESDEFVNDSIDRQAFEDYKESLNMTNKQQKEET
ncbi:hypothetical protein M9Y10_037155 [Tritrichomonas musculus]|uniref:Protein kinase domain-containing protein n=1 Tax=Tritrichomonas musculus TaxID=1915356 RepID=A0ABR2GU63_9EUKA